MKWTPRSLRWALNIWGPFAGSGIRIDYIRDDWREAHVSMKMRWYNRNAFGTHFGGSLYAMTDPQYVLMLTQILGKDYWVWDKSADIDFVSPGRGRVHAKFYLSDEEIDTIKQKTEHGEKYFPEFNVKVVDENNDIVANINKTLYIKKKPKRTAS